MKRRRRKHRIFRLIAGLLTIGVLWKLFRRPLRKVGKHLRKADPFAWAAGALTVAGHYTRHYK